MSEDETQPEKDVPQSTEKASAFVLKQKTPVAVTTTGLGEVYLHYPRMKDIERIAKSNEEHARGLTIIATLTDISDKPEERTGLSDENFNKLTPSDLEQLAAKIINSNNWPSTDIEVDTVTRLGRAYDQYWKEATKPIIESIEKARVQLAEPMKQLNGVLSEATKRLFTESLGVSSRLRDVLASSDWTERLLKEQGTTEAVLKNMSAAAAMGAEVSERFRKEQESYDAIIKDLSVTSNLDSLRSLASGVDDKYKYSAFDQGINGMEEWQRKERLITPPRPVMQPIINPATTPAGRTATAVENVSIKTETLIELHRSTLDELARMSQLLSSAVPEFMAKIKTDRDLAMSDQRTASDNLRIAKFAIIASVIVGILTMLQGWWFKYQDEQQQVRAETLLTKQNQNLNKLVDQNNNELAHLNEHVLILEKRLASIPAPQSSKITKVKSK